MGEGDPGLWDVQFITEKLGWVVGENGTIKMTSNGGRTWEIQGAGITDSNLSTLDFVNETTGWVVAEGGDILHTSNGGKTWIAQKSGLTEWLHGVDFVSDKEGIVTGEYGTVLRTTDGGETWNIEASGKNAGDSKYTFYDVTFLKPEIAYVAAEWGMILKYTP